jgi:hypothetical protein
MLETIMTLMLLFYHQSNVLPERAIRHARAIEHATTDHEEIRLLIAVDWGETQFGRAGRAFGVTCCYRNSLDEYARTAIQILERGERICNAPRGSRQIWQFYNTGRCGGTGPASRQYATEMLNRMERMQRVFP